MSFSLALDSKDIQIKGSTLGIVYDTAKLEQDLQAWLKERYGCDRFHTNYGSILDSFIGTSINDQSAYQVEAEVTRVLLNYQALQRRKLVEQPQSLSAAEILYSVDSVEAKTHYDTVYVSIRVRTATRATLSLYVSKTL